MDNAALELRAREIATQIVPGRVNADWQREMSQHEAEIWDAAFRAALTLATEMREACAKVAEEAFDRHGAILKTQRAHNYEHAGRRIAQCIRSLPDALSLPGEGDGDTIVGESVGPGKLVQHTPHLVAASPVSVEGLVDDHERMRKVARALRSSPSNMTAGLDSTGYDLNEMADWCERAARLLASSAADVEG